jgi:hypothetical protein
MTNWTGYNQSTQRACRFSIERFRRIRVFRGKRGVHHLLSIFRVHACVIARGAAQPLFLIELFRVGRGGRLGFGGWGHSYRSDVGAWWSLARWNEPDLVIVLRV